MTLHKVYKDEELIELQYHQLDMNEEVYDAHTCMTLKNLLLEPFSDHNFGPLRDLYMLEAQRHGLEILAVDV